MKTLLTTILLTSTLWSTQLNAQSFFKVKTPNMYWIIGSIDSVGMGQLKNEGVLYVEYNGVTKNIFCNHCADIVEYNGQWYFTMAIGTTNPESKSINIGIMDFDGMKIVQEPYKINQTVYYHKDDNPLESIFSLGN